MRRRRAVEIDDLRLVGHWCDLQSTDPRDDPRPDPTVPLPPGSDRLVQLGGEGTPRVRELTMCELGVARGVHPLAARAAAADVLDLRHRLPLIWAVFLAGRADAWLVRRVASMTRELSLAAVGVVDTAVAAAIAGEAPSRVLRIAEAKIIEADPAAHDAKVEAEKRRRYVSLTRTDETGLRDVIARVTAGDAAYVDAVLSRVADILAERPEHEGASRDLLRSLAFGWLARPAELLTLLLEHTQTPATPAHHRTRARARRPNRPTPSRRSRGRWPSPPTCSARSGTSTPPAPPPRRPVRPPARGRPHRGGRGGPGRGPRPAQPRPAHRAPRPHPGRGATRDRPERPDQRQPLRAPHPHQGTHPPPTPRRRVPPRLPGLAPASTSTTASPTGPRAHPGRPAPATANPSAGPDTAPRPTSATSASPSPPAAPSGAHPTACTDSSTSTAPTPSTRARPTPSPGPTRCSTPSSA